MWVPFDTFGEIKGRVRGVALPVPNGKVLVWTDRGLFSLWYFRSAFVNKLAEPAEADDRFDHTTGALTWDGTEHPLFGPAIARDPGAHTRHPGGDRVAVDPDDGSVNILDAAGGVRQLVCEVPAGAWALAGFGADGKALVVADSTTVRVFRYEAVTGTERPRWSAVADPSDQARLLKAVQANPDEDTPRLMYADWLDEYDDPARAEFVRLQCRYAERAAREPVPATDPDHQRLFQLSGQLSERWLAEMPVIRGVKWAGFWRGFPGVSVASPTTLVRSAAKIWDAAPVEMAAITDLNVAGAKALATSDVFRRLRVLSLERYYIRQDGDGPLRALFHAPRAAALKRLILPRTLGDAGITVIAQSPHLSGLEWLDIGSGCLTDATADVLIAAPGLRGLRGGSFVSYRLSDAAKKRLRDRFPTAIV